jgi:hypothetical protein
LNDASYSFLGDLEFILLQESTVDFTENELQLRECLLGKNAYIVEPESTASEEMKERRDKLVNEPMVIDVAEVACVMTLVEYNKDKFPYDRLEFRNFPDCVIQGQRSFLPEAYKIYSQKHEMLTEHLKSLNSHMQGISNNK